MSTPLPTIVIRPTPRISAIRLVLAIFAGLIALFLGLLVLLLIGIETGPIALLLGLLAATIPVPIYVALVLWIDRYEAEPLWMLATAFFWGALAATFFAFLLNTGSAGIVTILTNAKAGEAFAAVISAPIVEETGKALILFIFFFWKKDEFDGVVDGIVYASLAALGFAMTENILYYGRAALGGGGSLTLTLIIRGFFAPFSHPLFTSMTGIGLGLARQSTNIVGEDIDSDRRFDDGDLHAQYLERLGSVRWQRGFLTHLHRRDDSCFHYHARRHRLRAAT